MTEAAAISVSEMTREQRVLTAYQAGRLRFKVLEHRRAHYDKFRAWAKYRQTEEYSRWCQELCAQYGRVYMDESARKTAKTGTSLIIAVEECVQFANRKGYGARGMIAIPQKTKIGGVVVPISKEIFRDAPPGYAPEYRGSGDGEHEHLYIPAVEARIKLVGLDKNKEALRGPYLDFCVITEAGFVIGLEDVYVSEIKDQFQGRPWAWCLMESSTPKTLDHDFNVEFKPDCRIRDAYTSMVITDNTRLTQQEIEDEIRESGGLESARCQRELFNIVKPDEEQMVVPEFNEAVHVVRPQDWPRPMYALAYEGIDPGTSDPLGYVAFYLDFDRQTIVVEKSFMRPNMSTGEFVAEVVKPTEHELWGTELESVERRDEARRELRMVQMQRIANANVLPDGTVWEAPPGSLTYWDAASWSLRPNPIARISDTHARFILDLNRDYGLSVREAEKEPGSAEADIEYLRELFRARHAHNGMPKIVILDNGKTTQLIQQLRSGMWKLRDDVHKVDWTRSKLLGHLDCLAALKYAVRDVRWTRNPKPPAVVDVHRNNLHVPKELMPPGTRPQAVPIGTNSGPRMSVGARLGIQPQGARPRFR